MDWAKRGILGTKDGNYLRGELFIVEERDAYKLYGKEFVKKKREKEMKREDMMPFYLNTMQRVTERK